MHCGEGESQRELNLRQNEKEGKAVGGEHRERSSVWEKNDNDGKNERKMKRREWRWNK